MNIDIPKDALTAVIHKAIFDSLAPETRDKLLEGAIKQMLEVPATTYGPKESLLQQIFTSECTKVVRELVATQLANDPKVREVLSNLVTSALTKAIVEKHDDLVCNIANIIVRVLEPRDR
jgi:hypothetical protein